MTELSYTHGGGVVVRFDGEYPKYLLVRSSTNRTHWVFPKGHIKPGESPETAALREVREEAGVKAEIVSRLGDSEFTKEVEKVRVLYFVMRYKARCQEAAEDREIKWCLYEEAAAKLSFDDARRLLAKANTTLT